MSRVPEPLAVDGAVAVDVAARTVTVQPSSPGLGALLWRAGYEALVRDEGRAARALVRDEHPALTVWASGFGKRQVAMGQPEGGALKFAFRRGDPVWGQLLTAADLSAIVTVDRASRRIMSVKFRGRSG